MAGNEASEHSKVSNNRTNIKGRSHRVPQKRPPGSIPHAPMRVQQTVYTSAHLYQSLEEAKKINPSSAIWYEEDVLRDVEVVQSYRDSVA